MLRFFIPFIGLAACVATPALAKDVPNSAMTRRIFDITRNGNRIGTDVVDIETRGDTTTVKIANHISVSVMFIEAYRLDAKAVETWTKGRFVSYRAFTDDNGTKHNVSAAIAGRSLLMTIDGKRSTLPHQIIPATLWNKDFISAAELLDPEKGTVLSARVKDLGDEMIQIHGTSVHARHYKITGDLPRDIWFEGDVPVRVALLGPDRSKIVSDLRQLPVE